MLPCTSHVASPFTCRYDAARSDTRVFTIRHAAAAIRSLMIHTLYCRRYAAVMLSLVALRYAYLRRAPCCRAAYTPLPLRWLLYFRLRYAGVYIRHTPRAML